MLEPTSSHRQQDFRVAKNGESLRVNPRVATGLLIGLSVVAHLPGFGGAFIWDDDAHVTESRAVVDPGGLPTIWFEPGSVPQYYPLTHSSFWLEYRLWGDNPTGYHAVNILLHVASVVVLWRLLAGLGVSGAWLAAALFAVHPVHVESVAWISERKNVLSGLFALLSTVAWLSWWRAEPGTAGRRWWLAVGFFAAALFSKTVTVTLPAAWLVICWWQGGRVGRREWLSVLPMLLLAVPMGLVTVWSEQRHIGAGHLDLGLSALDRILVAGRAIWFYAGKLFWPTELAFIYPRWTIDSASILQWIYPLAAVLVLFALWCQRSRVGRGPLSAGLLFVGTLAPALGFVDIYPMQFSFVADHFQYLASIPLLVAAAWLMVTRRYPTLGGAALLILLGLAWVRGPVFLDNANLWTDTVAKNPRSPLALTSLGNELGAAGSHKLAERRHREAIAVDNEFPDAWVNLSVELQVQAKHDEAFDAARQAVRLAPWLPRARVNLALGLTDRERYDEAVEQLEAAVATDSRFSAAWFHLARVELLRNNQSGFDTAVEQLRRLDPRLARDFEPSP